MLNLVVSKVTVRLYELKERFNLLEPCVLYIERAYRYPPDVAFYIFFSRNICTVYFKHAAHYPFFLFKMPFIS